MGCSSSNSTLGDGVQKVQSSQKSLQPSEEKTENINYPPSEAYVISFNTDDNVIADHTIVTTSTWNAAAAAKTEVVHPPERLQKVLEAQTNANAATDSAPTIETITEKLEKAEQRRQAIIQHKIEKAQKLMKNLDETFHENEHENEHEKEDGNQQNSSQSKERS